MANKDDQIFLIGLACFCLLLLLLSLASIIHDVF